MAAIILPSRLRRWSASATRSVFGFAVLEFARIERAKKDSRRLWLECAGDDEGGGGGSTDAPRNNG